MKNISKILLLAALSAAAVACTKVDIGHDGNSENRVNVLINASTSNDTKTTVDFGNPDIAAGETVKWLANDKISLFISGQKEARSLFRVKTLTNDNLNAVFEGSVPVVEGVQTIYALSPAIPFDDPSNIQYVYPSYQTQIGTTADHIGSDFMMYAKVKDVNIPASGTLDGVNLRFKHLGSMLRFRILNTTTEPYKVVGVMVSERGANKMLYDHMIIDLTQQTLTSTPAGTTMKRKAVRVEDAPIMAAGTGVFDAYMAIAPQTARTAADDKMIIKVFVENEVGEEFSRILELNCTTTDLIKNGFETGLRYQFSIELSDLVEDNFYDPSVWHNFGDYSTAVEDAVHNFNLYRLDQGHVGQIWNMIAGDMWTGAAVLPNRTTGWFWNLYTFNSWNENHATEFTFSWQYSYAIVKDLNQLIDNVNKVPTTDKSQEVDMKRFKAELLGLRALLFHQLNYLYATRWEGGNENGQLSVPLARNSKESAASNPRNTSAEVIAQVEKDLGEAIAIYEANSFVQRTDRFNQTFAYVLKARIHMYKQEYDQALAFAQKALARNSKVMGVADYYGGFNSIENSEWIFGGKVNNSYSPSFGSFFAYYGANYSSTFIRSSPMAMDTRYLDQIPNTDRRKVTAEGKMGIFITDDQSVIYNNKSPHYFELGFIPTPGSAVFTGNSRKYLQTSIGTLAGAGDMVYCRVAEVLYIAAEAALLQGDAALAAKYLTDAVKPYDASFVAPATTDELLAKIALYKVFDLWGEGHSFPDFKRRGTLVDRSGSNHPSNAVLFQYGAMPGQPRNDVWKLKISEIISSNNPNLQLTDQ